MKTSRRPARPKVFMKSPPRPCPPGRSALQMLIELQEAAAAVLATRRPLSMATSHVDDDKLDSLVHVLIRQGVEIKKKVV